MVRINVPRGVIRLMKALEVKLNGRKLCIAGVEDGVVSAVMSYVCNGKNHDLALSVSGLIRSDGATYSWTPRRKIRSGDEVLVRVIDTQDVDKPRRLQGPLTPAARRREEERYVREMAKKLGWKIVSKPI